MTTRWAACVLLCGAVAGCSLLLDNQSNQCRVDADCIKFGGHPFCQEGLCVASGLGPPDCVPGTPSSQTDFLNACTTSTYAVFDNCARLGLCDPNTTLPPPTEPTRGTAGSTTPPPAPTNLCTDGAPTTSGVPNMIWLYGSADFGPLMRAAQPSLSTQARPYRAVFQNASSCQGVASILDPDPTKRLMKDPPTETQGGWAFYFDDNGDQVNCRVDSVGTSDGVPIDIGISDLYSETCGYTPGPTVAEYTGPVVPFVLAVKAGSPENSISAEAAHMVFGNGGMAPPGSGLKDASPWTDHNKFFIRNSGAGSTVLTSLLIDVDRNSFWGIDRLSTDNLRDGLLAATDVASSIGILSIDYYDKNRGNLKALYLQSTGQGAGYLPDSTPTTIDKANVRDGHYPLWGYVHFIAPLNAVGGLSPAANAMILLFNVPKIEQRLVDEIINASETPQCAMKVERTSEIGDFSLRTGFRCGCYFDFKTRGRTDCQTCTTAEDCPGRSPCNYGFCEVGS